QCCTSHHEHFLNKGNKVRGASYTSSCLSAITGRKPSHDRLFCLLSSTPRSPRRTVRNGSEGNQFGLTPLPQSASLLQIWVSHCTSLRPHVNAVFAKFQHDLS